MVMVVTSANAAMFERELDEMFKFRHEVAVGEMGWTLPDARDGYDIDRYDTKDTIYFLDYGKSGQLVASARLNPTTQPHLLSDVFPEFCKGDVPRGDEIYEYSRYLVSKARTDKIEFVMARARILLALNEYALANGIRMLTLLTYRKHYSLAAHLFRTRPLGEPIYYESDDAEYMAMTCDVTAEGIERIEEYTRLKSPIASMVVPLSLAEALPRSDWTPRLPEVA